MRRNKPGLADLKRLRQQAESPRPATPPITKRTARKRAPFQMPGARPAETAAAPKILAPAEPAAISPQVSEADRRLFRSAVRHVEKMKDPNRVLLAPTALAQPAILMARRLRAAGIESGPKPVPRVPANEPPSKMTAAVRQPRALSDSYAPADHHNDDSRFLRLGHGPDVLKDLKKGKWSIGASLDLHGSTLEEARERFDRFLSSCIAHEIKCVRIVHGKGYGSRDGDAVLKTTVRRWLTQIDEVVAYTECAETDGGSGAVQVLLK